MAKRINIQGELTKAELEVMQILWKRCEAFVSDILEDMAEPKPAYNTVSTVVRVLEKKGFAAHRSYGKSHRYYPLVGEEEYKSQFMNSVVNTFFDSSISNMFSFFCEKEHLSMAETEEIIALAKKAIAERKAEK